MRCRSGNGMLCRMIGSVERSRSVERVCSRILARSPVALLDFSGFHDNRSHHWSNKDLTRAYIARRKSPDARAFH